MKKFLATILSVVLLLTIVPMAYAEESNTYKVGDIIQFGSYPQSEVKDKNLIAELNALAPEWDDWTSYGYYTGTGKLGSMFNGDWMRCVDIKHDGIKYRGVKFTQCRPNLTFYISSNTDQDDNGYSTNTVYWFIFESIDWRVLDPSTGLVLCETIIDAQPYSNTVYYNRDVSDSRYAYFNDFFSYKNYASDYETSSIRKWLNEDFYNIAFTDSEKKEISITTLNNDGYYTSNGTTGYEKLDSNATEDNIFLLSYNEVRNSDFGFSSDEKEEDASRKTQGSDYAKCQGLFVYSDSESSSDGNSHWILRSPGDSSYNCCYVTYNGLPNNNYLVNSTIYGVRPALKSDAFKHKHSYSSAVTKEATHLEFGEKTYTCECGDTYTEKVDKLTNHTYTSSVTKEPTHLEEGVRTYTCECTDSYTESIPKLTEHTYNSVVTNPTCTEQGYTTYTCECGDTYTDNYTDVNGHSFTNYISDGKATCSTNGLKIAKCDNCNATDSIVESGDHSFSDEWTIDVEPTCTAEGSKSHHCENCSDKANVTPMSKLAHTYKKVTIEPSCTEKGYNVYTCSCGDTYTEIIEATGHDFDGSACKNCDFDKVSDCSCNCHKGGISGFFWKIINFFNKLFKSKQYCGCGAKHW